jgi:hypothetical protein
MTDESKVRYLNPQVARLKQFSDRLGDLLDKQKAVDAEGLGLMLITYGVKALLVAGRSTKRIHKMLDRAIQMWQPAPKPKIPPI